MPPDVDNVARKASICLITQDECPDEALARVRILDSDDEAQASVSVKISLYFLIRRSNVDREMGKDVGTWLRPG